MSSVVLAQGEHSRRVAAELRVIAGDIERLQQSSSTELHATGLTHRVLGGLAALDILMRLADQETGKPVLLHIERVNAVRQQVVSGRFDDVKGQIQTWLSVYPLTVPATATNEAPFVANGERLHAELCAACHDNPYQDTERPAYNLFEEAEVLAADEFFARMLTGVRGDRVTGIDNPLTDYQLAALISYYHSGNK